MDPSSTVPGGGRLNGMVAKGNRAVAVREACKKHGGFYLGSIGGAAANLAEHCIKKVEVVEYPELGMEAIWRIEVVISRLHLIDDKATTSSRIEPGLIIPAREKLEPRIPMTNGSMT